MARAVAMLCFLAAACRFEADYRDTHFACGAVEPRCPSTQTCLDGVCVAGVPDAGGDGDPIATPDAAAVVPLPDGAEPSAPDATPPLPPGLEAAADATLDSRLPTHNHGAALDLAIRNVAPRATAVMRFDLSAIVPGTQIEHAILHVHVAAGGDDDAVVEVHRVLEAWQEGGAIDASGAASWRDRRDAVAWSGEGAQGGSRGIDVMGTIHATGAGDYAVPLDPATVQSWVTSPSNNQGVVLIGVGGVAVRLVSREGPTALRPRLELTLR
jgi:hypothetical protein